MLIKLYTSSIVAIVEDYMSIKTHPYNKLRLPSLSSIVIFKIGNPIQAQLLSLNTSSVAFSRDYPVVKVTSGLCSQLLAC